MIIKETKDAIVELLKNCSLVTSSQCAVITQSTTSQKDIEEAVRSEVGFCITVYYNGMKFEGVEFDNVDMPPITFLNFEISIVHGIEQESGIIEQDKVLDELIQIHNSVTKTASGKNVKVKLVESPITILSLEPYSIYSLEVQARLN